MQAVLRDLPPVGHIGRYAVLGKLATGGMAEIFLARADMAHGAWRLVVLKRILAHVADDPEHVSAFVQEARLSLRLQHPNICTVYEVGEDRGRTFLVMEYVDGVRLSDLVDLTGALPAPLAARIVADVAAALEHAHGLVGEDGEPLGIVHRDVTPDNIMLGFDGRVKLLDFGIAKARTQSRLTQAGVLKGKVAYMSPEQYRGEALDGRSDVFALGACFYEALTGKSAFDRGTDAQTVAAILFDDAPLSPHAVRPEVPEALDDLVRGAVARSQERRPSAGALLRELEAWLDGRPAKTTERDIAALLEATFDQSPPELDRTPLDAAPRLDAATTAAVRAELDDVVESMRARSRRQRALLVLIALVVVVAAGSAVAWKLTMAPPPDGPGAQDARDEPSDAP
ncbi:MAG: serine/threonine protein kinase [Myxococcales bacterium]|nr:serine/threonine protein kinase [Myxococcales bacterium]